MSFRVFASFLWQLLSSQILHVFFRLSKSRHVSYTLVYPAWFFLLYFYYCNMLFLPFPLEQLDQLLAEQSHLFSELKFSDWKWQRKAQNKQVFPDAVDTVHSWRGCSKMMHKRAPGKNMIATGFLSAPQQVTSSVKFLTRALLDPNSAEPAPQQLSTSNKEVKEHPQGKTKFKTSIYNVRSFRLSPKVLNGRDCWPAVQFYCSLC